MGTVYIKFTLFPYFICKRKLNKYMDSNIFRINDYSLIKVINKKQTSNFHLVADTQYVCATEKDWNKTVWVGNFQSKNTKYRLNKVYSNTGLLPVPDINTAKQLACLDIEIILRQNYSFNGVFGLLVTIFEPNTNKMYISQMLQLEDFEVMKADEKILIDGSFWLEHSTVQIPLVSNMSVQITEIRYADIEKDGANIGLIYNYPQDFIPLISEKTIPDYIQTKVNIDYITGILTIVPYTTNNQSLEKALLDYFEQEVADIKISHLITYGVNTAGNERYKQLRVSNEVNKYLPISLSLDLTDFAGENNIDVVVTTEIVVNGKLVQRTATITINNTNFINPDYVGKIKHPDTIYPVNVMVEHNIQQSVIQKDKEIAEVTVIKQVFAEIIKDTIVIENKNIVFNEVTEPCYLQINNTDTLPIQIIQCQKTADSVYYFDIHDVIPVDKETTYFLKTVGTDMIIAQGAVKPTR